MPGCGVRPSTSSGRLEPVEAARSDPCQSVFIRGSYDACSSVAVLWIRVFVESERDLRSLDQDRTTDEIRLLHHQIDGFLLGLWERSLFEYRAARAHEVEEPVGVDVPLEERSGRRLLVDVVLVNIDVLLVQITSGVSARGSGRFPIENRSHHARILPAAGSMFPASTMDPECSPSTKSSIRSRENRPIADGRVCSSG